MPLFGRKKRVDPVGAEVKPHPLRVMDNHHAREREVVVTLTPEEQAAISWRQDYDRRRTEAFANQQGCGKCIGGVVSFRIGKEVGSASCNCSFSKPVA